jgi:hypothetical protein
VSEVLGTPALRQLLLELPARIPLERLDRLWVFSPREIGGREHGLLVLALLPADAAEEPIRHLLTLRYQAQQTAAGIRRTDTLAEQGSAPPERLPRVIAGVLHRLRDESEEPLEVEVAGSPERWHGLLRRFGIEMVDPRSGE